jgi:DNA-3-methyladenine glycosylase
MMGKIGPEFFQRDPVTCARELVGCLFWWGECAGKIVETEAYSAEGDEACHTFFRPSSRDFVERHQAGDAYVYLNYGVHWLFNVLVKGEEGAGFVLLRALEPVAGQAKMRERRGNIPDHGLCSGPGKLTRALGIQGVHHGTSFLHSATCGIEAGVPENLCEGPRIGISKAADHPWRFGEKFSRSLSRNFA